MGLTVPFVSCIFRMRLAPALAYSSDEFETITPRKLQRHSIDSTSSLVSTSVPEDDAMSTSAGTWDTEDNVSEFAECPAAKPGRLELLANAWAGLEVRMHGIQGVL